jgi:nucleotide-binding universal stress UspA family protein
MFNKILCPTDLAQRSYLALEKAVQLAHQFDAEITLLNVHPEFMNREDREMLRVSVEKIKEKYHQTALMAKEKMRESIKRLHAEDIALSYLLRGGKIAATILAVAGEIGADLIVMASDGRDNIGDFVAGTITEQVVSKSRLPVLVVPCTTQ